MKNELEGGTKAFAVAITKSVSKLPQSKAGDVLGRQLLKCGTLISANYREAGRAQSHDDFISKIAICEKEAAETEYWLELLIDTRSAGCGGIGELLAEARELLAIFVASGRTAKARR